MMTKEAHKLLIENNETHWWNVSKDKILLYLIKTLELRKDMIYLELGVGTGCFISKLEYPYKIGIDLYPYKQNKGQFQLIQGNVNLMPIKDNCIDVIFSIDLLEHIKEDKLLITNIISKLKKKGILVLLVPAFQILWSDLDVIGCHYRRYTKKQIYKLLNNSNFSYNIIKSTYLNIFLFPLIVIIRFVQNIIKRINNKYNTSCIKKPSRVINNILKWIFSSERYLLRYLNFPFGTSYLIILEKQ